MELSLFKLMELELLIEESRSRGKADQSYCTRLEKSENMREVPNVERLGFEAATVEHKRRTYTCIRTSMRVNMALQDALGYCKQHGCETGNIGNAVSYIDRTEFSLDGWTAQW